MKMKAENVLAGINTCAICKSVYMVYMCMRRKYYDKKYKQIN